MDYIECPLGNIKPCMFKMAAVMDGWHELCLFDTIYKNENNHWPLVLILKWIFIKYLNIYDVRYCLYVHWIKFEMCAGSDYY